MPAGATPWARAAMSLVALTTIVVVFAMEVSARRYADGSIVDEAIEDLALEPG